jgi:hypothetical protein
MAITFARADGALLSTDTPAYTTLYTCPVGKQAWVKSIVVANIDSVSRQFDIFRVSTGDPVVLNDVDKTLAAGACSANVAGFALVAGDQIQGWCDVDNMCTYAISIIEQAI